MRAQILRATIVLLVLTLLWALPVPSLYVGGIGNYRVWNWGLYGWLKSYDLKSGFFAASSGAKYITFTTGLLVTIGASVFVIGVGACWVWAWKKNVHKQQHSGLLVFLIPAVFWVIQIWWPDVYGIAGGGRVDFHYSRGKYGYLVEYREDFELAGFLPATARITGTLALNFMGLLFTLLASFAILTIAIWLGSKLSRSSLLSR